MVHEIVTAAGLLLVGVGVFAFFTAGLGLYRMKYVLNRVHAAAIGDSLGIFCIVVGLMLLRGWSMVSAKMLLIPLFLWLTNPVAGHLVGAMEVLTNPNIEKECEVEER